MKRLAMLLLPGLFAFFAAEAQNMVHNGGFEQYISCPGGPSEMDLATDWNTPTTGTSDYFNTCATQASNAGIPMNILGYQLPYQGHGYAGVYNYGSNYREYLRGTLVPLTPGLPYKVTIHISKANSSTSATDGFGVLFYKNGFDVPINSDTAILTTPQVDYSPAGIITDTLNWVTLADTLIADSAYTHIIIGNFRDDAHTGYSGTANGLAYYYIDSVEVLPVFMAITSQTWLSCYGDSSSTAAVTAMGGTAPYSYLWLPGQQVTAAISTLSAGTYTCIVSDAAQDTIIKIVTINAPPILTATSFQTDVNCYGEHMGQAAVTAGGGKPPYSYSWMPVSCSNPIATSLAAGAYTCFVTDANDCTLNKVFVINEPAPLTIVATHTGISCAGEPDGSITINAAGGTPPYDYSWSMSNGHTATVNNLDTGVYTGTVTDAHGCIAHAAVTLSYLPNTIFANFSYEPLLPIPGERVDFHDLSTGMITGWYWDMGNGSSSVDAEPITWYDEPGTYKVCFTANDIDNCTDTMCKDINVDIANHAAIPSAFSPNGDGVNDVLYIRGNKLASVRLFIYNRWGMLVFASNKKEKGWDGNYRGQPQNAETYAYTLEVTFTDGRHKQVNGDVTLLR